MKNIGRVIWWVLLLLILAVATAVVTIGGDPCYQDREVLCGKSREAANLLSETNRARIVLEDGMRLARCE